MTALSLSEIKAGVRHAAAQEWSAFVLVSHSFELINLERGIANLIVKRRFEALCAWLQTEPGIGTGGFHDQAVRARLDVPGRKPTAAPRHRLREMLRIGEQAYANVVYG